MQRALFWNVLRIAPVEARRWTISCCWAGKAPHLTGNICFNTVLLESMPHTTVISIFVLEALLLLSYREPLPSSCLMGAVWQVISLSSRV